MTSGMADEREHPAQPFDDKGEGFAEGQEEVRPEPPDQERVRDYGEGQELDPDTPEEEHVGRFSEGEEEEPDSPEKERPGSFGDHDE